LAILRTWEGGMAFHGGLVGVIIAILLFARHAKVDKWYVGDGVACAVPIGLGLGRLANFINGELWGRTAPDVHAWEVLHRHKRQDHPSYLQNRQRKDSLCRSYGRLRWRGPLLTDT
jgi:phosphatidylglycerol:prolipoprotein diacylglycerol transferase